MYRPRPNTPATSNAVWAALRLVSRAAFVILILLRRWGSTAGATVMRVSESRSLDVRGPHIRRTGPAALPRGCAGSRPFASEESWVGEVQEGEWRGKGAGLSDITDCICWVCLFAWRGASTSPGQDRGKEVSVGWVGAKKRKKKVNTERVGLVIYDHEAESCSDAPGRRRSSQEVESGKIDGGVRNGRGASILESPGRLLVGRSWKGCQAVTKLRRARRAVTESGCWRTPKKPLPAGWKPSDARRKRCTAPTVGRHTFSSARIACDKQRDSR